MKLSEILSPDCIKVGLEAEDKEEAIAELVEQLVRARRIPDRSAAVRCIFERERRQSTGIGHGVAIPHGKDATVPQLALAVGISQTGIEFDSLDGEPVYSVFLLLTPIDKKEQHLSLMKNFASQIRKEHFCDFLRQNSGIEGLVELLKEFESK